MMTLGKLDHPPPPAAYQDPSSSSSPTICCKQRPSGNIFELENDNSRLALKIEALKSPTESLSPGILSPVSAISVNSFNGKYMYTFLNMYLV